MLVRDGRQWINKPDVDNHFDCPQSLPNACGYSGYMNASETFEGVFGAIECHPPFPPPPPPADPEQMENAEEADRRLDRRT